LTPIQSEGSLTVFLTYTYFIKITLVLIGVDCLVSAILGIFLIGQKRNPLAQEITGLSDLKGQ
jgi:hypothetical protein